MKIKLFTFLMPFTLVACANTKEITEARPMRLTDSNIFNCLLIEKEGSGNQLYLRCSVQDYFIDLCAGKVSRSQLIPYLNSGVEVEIEIKEGISTSCGENQVTNKNERYIIVNRIVN